MLIKKAGNGVVGVVGAPKTDKARAWLLGNVHSAAVGFHESGAARCAAVRRRVATGAGRTAHRIHHLK
ncbi:hypothetical protein [Mycobacterium sp.]|uniref:hypothetical protein n=1 Tax=Mycobacterium sp. TaxID=1785 RepID=UPI003F96DB24